MTADSAVSTRSYAGRSLPWLTALRPWAGRLVFPGALLSIALVMVWQTLRGLGLENLHDWDESRHIVNAYEMWRSGDYLISTYLGVPDYYNLKPPLSFWSIVAGMQVFGFNPLAVRLPSLLAAYATIAVVTVFAYRFSGRIAAVVAMAVCSSSQLLLNFHSGRTADPDALFNLFMTVAALTAITAPRRPWLLLVSTTAISGAFLTKSFHACIAIVFLALYLCWARTDTKVRPRHLGIALAGFLPVVVWSVARYLADGGQFLAGMVQYDLLARSSSTIEGHSGPPWVYVQFLLYSMAPWLLLAFGALCLVLQSEKNLLARLLRPRGDDRLLAGLALWTVLVVGAFSVAVSKLYWYVTDTVGVIAVAVGITVAIAARRTTVTLRLLLALTGGAALVLGMLAIRDAKVAEGVNPLQAAMATVERNDLVAGAPVYLDDGLGAWTQSAAASAELSLDGRPKDGGYEGYLQDRSPVKVLVTSVNSDAHRVLTSGREQIVLLRESGGFSIIAQK